MLTRSFLILSIFLGAFTLNAETAYIKGLKATIYAEPNNSADKIAKLARGEEVTVVDKKGFWRKVKSSKVTGWLPALMISKKKPKNKISVLDKKTNMSQKARKRASTFTSAAAARGLTESGRKRIGKMQQPDFNALEKVEKETVDEEEAIEYLNK
jgi:hypothetical protein